MKRYSVFLFVITLATNVVSGGCPTLSGLFDKNPKLLSPQVWKISQEECKQIQLSFYDLTENPHGDESIILTLVPAEHSCDSFPAPCRTFTSDNDSINFRSNTCSLIDPEFGRCYSNQFKWTLDSDRNLVETCVAATCADGHEGDVSHVFYRRK